MALLNYQNFKGRRFPELLMKDTFYGLKLFYDFLSRTMRYMESDEALKRLAWEKGQVPERNARILPVDENGDKEIGAATQDEPPEGVWVRLIEPRDRPNESEATFRLFMDENVHELHEVINEVNESDVIWSGHETRHVFRKNNAVTVLDRDPESYQLLLDRYPTRKQLMLRPNTYTLQKQLSALQALQDAPQSYHEPLLRLMKNGDYAEWPNFDRTSLDEGDWMVLTDGERPGTDEQRAFVEIGLSTPDFAFLNGPPGSGKTTAICELILQLAIQGKRVLLCASTHVAVDNVLERLMDERNIHRDVVIPVRIGERRNVSEKAAPWQLENFVNTERNRLLRELKSCDELSRSRQELFNALKSGNTMIERLVLEASNLVCGTTIGILKHPSIAKGRIQVQDPFDVMIIDEASKTTFQEFLVPALLARRWILVGDPKQLSPYVDDDSMAVNIKACLGDETVRNACVDVFVASHANVHKQRVSIFISESERERGIYCKQAEARKVPLIDLSDEDTGQNEAPWTFPIVVGNPGLIMKHADELPLDATTIRTKGGEFAFLKRQADAIRWRRGRMREEMPSWETEVSWRLSRVYEQRFVEEGGGNDQSESASRKRGVGRTAERLRREVSNLLPDSFIAVEYGNVWESINRVRRVALPSILESLHEGFERHANARTGSALTDGVPVHALYARSVLLSTQHRMHPEIASFPREHVYLNEALHTPDYMEARRKWGYSEYSHRVYWMNVSGGFNQRLNANPKEAKAIVDELKRFCSWAENNPRDDGLPWEVAVLTFYRGQERELRKEIRKWSGNNRGVRRFHVGRKRVEYATIELCTVDRFQGHEADVVYLSFSNSHPTSFLESPNRLNVALTRARYQLVVFGDRNAMGRARPGMLLELVRKLPWEKQF